MTIAYPSVHIFVNITNCWDSDKEEEALPEMKEIAKFAKHHIPEKSEKDNSEFVLARNQKLIKLGLISVLSVFAMSDHVLMTEGLRELMARLIMKTSEDQTCRGTIMAQGGGKTLIALSKKNNTIKGKVIAAQGVARLCITTNPVLAFPGQKTYEAIGVLLTLLVNDHGFARDTIMNFEGLMALTNIAAIDEGHRNKIVQTKEMIPSIENCALEEHEMVRRAAVQLRLWG